MAIFAPHHGFVGRSTQKQAGTAGAHVHYITRTGAARLLIGEHMPTGRHQARAWMDEREAADRKNARVCDKLMLPLPLELDAQQRTALVREFMQDFGNGRVAWLAAFHDRGKDEHNPHAHVILRDKDHEKGGRVFGTTEKGSTERIRELWETAINRALEREGIDARVDRRSLAEQGLDREPGIHVGPNVRQMEDRGLRPVSLAQDHTTSRGNDRVIDWPEIDQGRTRADRQREIEAMNREREDERSRGKGDQVAELVPAHTPAPVHQREPSSARVAFEATREAFREQRAALDAADWQSTLDAIRAREGRDRGDDSSRKARSAMEALARTDPLGTARNFGYHAGDRLKSSKESQREAEKIMNGGRTAAELEAEWQRGEAEAQAERNELAAYAGRQREAFQQQQRMRAAFEALVKASREPERAPLVKEPEQVATRVADQEREAIQGPSHEVATREPDPKQIEIGLERSRLVQFVMSGRERLAAFTGRLEQAFQAVMQRQPVRQPDPRQDLISDRAAAERDPWAEMIELGRKVREEREAADRAAGREKEPKRERDDWGRSLGTDYSQGRERKGPGF